MKPFGFISVGVAAGFVLGAALMNMTGLGVANAAGGGLSKTDVEAIVKEYIAAHGEELVASVQTAANKQQAAKLAKVVDSDAPTKGPVDAPVTIVEFSDFQCPFCDKVQGTLTELRAKYGDKIRWVYKNLPLDFHPQARPAAYAAQAAHLQGKFWEYSQQLWAQQANLGDKTYVAIAQSLKLDMDKFNKDRASDAVKAKIDADMVDAEAMGARGTPHFIINGEAMSGAIPAEQFSQAIDAQLKK